MTAAALAAAYEAARGLVATMPALAAFATLPEAALAEKPGRRIPATALVEAWEGSAVPATQPVIEAIRAATPYADWQQTYREEEVGADFLARYGWFELAGPTGHVQTTEARAFIAYWGAGLHYDWHLHEAEGLYVVLAGRATFLAEGAPPAEIGPGGTRHHAAFQPHAMTTTDSAVLTLVLWRGAGLDGMARMGRA